MSISNYLKNKVTIMTSKPICIIPARGGSKRIPRKNIISFNGKPLIAWPIETALQSEVFSKVIVTTDDDEIATIAQKYGAEIPFMRAAGLANDFATTAEVIRDALTKLEQTDHVCCLYPTAPLIRADDFQNAYSRLVETNSDCVITVTEYDFHPLRAFQVEQDGKLDFKWSENALTRSQDLPNLLHDAGAFYFFKTAAFIKQNKIVMEKTTGYQIERSRAVDIDTLEDLEFAKLLHQHTLKV